MRNSIVLLTAALLLTLTVGLAASREFFVYFGTYTGQASQGVYVSRFNAATGELSAPALAVETRNPSFLAIHPGGGFLYAVGEVGGGPGSAGTVSAFSVDRASGKLSLLNTVSSKGGGPCHVSVDHKGEAVLVANYGGGSVAAMKVRSDGRLDESVSFIQHAGSSVNASRQKGPHAHSINLSPDNRFAIAADLGLDQLLVYRFDPAAATLAPNAPPFVAIAPGSGPRHFAFHTSGKFAYAISEMKNTVTAFTWDASRGVLNETQSISTLPPEFKGESYTAEVQVHPSGRFLYGSNRGHDSIAAFEIDVKTGKLTLLELVPTQGQFPRNFGIDPTGSWLFAANQKTNNIVVFRLDPKTGRLTPAGKTLEVGSPVCVKFLAAN